MTNFPSVDFSQRSYEKELLDRDDIPFPDIRQNMEELNFINTYLGGHNITINGLQQLLAASGPQKRWLVCEIGSGGGDNLIAVHKWMVKRNIKAEFIGIDINPFCTRVAEEKCSGLQATFITADYRMAKLAPKPDLIFSSLFCHHFTDSALVSMLQWMQANAVAGFFINDLHRHPLAYYSIKVLTGLFSASYLVKNDAPLSVMRGFRKNEWESLLKAAGITGYSIRWKWAFRHLVVVRKLSAVSHQPSAEPG